MTSSKDLAKLRRKELPPKAGERLMDWEAVLSACTYPPAALEIIGESDFTTHNRVGLHRHIRASNVLNDFFSREHFEGKTILELGPGHYSFAMLARALGATVICVERYDVHVELGRALGFEVLDIDFRELTPEKVGRPVDGLWMKGAFNACVFRTDEDVTDFVRIKTALLAPEAWGWCVTVNMTPKDQPPDLPFLEHRIEVQRSAYEQFGWTVRMIDEADRKRYAVSYQGSPYYFVRGLPRAESMPAPTGVARGEHRS
ncbi:MAG: hypothetical protein KC983_02125 [Phycisphaerales bacterium]|nr:hypothetical protein [Phycisphaerales bacterium]